MSVNNISVQEPSRRHHQVSQQIRSMIERGELADGQRMPSTQELARQLSVSCTTVQKALANLVDEGMLERKQRKGTFVSSKPVATSSIGFYYFSERQPMIMDLVEAMHPVFNRRRLDIKLIPFGRKFFDEAVLLEDARNRGLQGLIITPLDSTACLNQLKKLEQASFPYVRIANDCWDDQLTAPLVASDYGVITSTCSMLAEMGHTAIGLLGSEAGNPWEAMYLNFVRQFSGYRDSWRLPIEHGPVLGKPWEFGNQIARGYLHENPELTAVIAWHPLHAKHVVEQARQMGRSVPDQLSVVCMYDWTRYGIEMAASAYHHPYDEAGKAAATYLVSMLDGHTPPRTTRIPLQLNDYGTIATAPSLEDGDVVLSMQLSP